MKGAPAALPVVSAQGVHLELADGRRLLDGIANWWTAAHGHRHPHITAALHAQLDTLHHVMLGGLVHPQAERLAQRLAALCPGDLDHVFFSESGSVSVEVALKMAVQHWHNRGKPGRRRFLAFHGGYHGDTLAAMSVCDPEEGLHALFRGVLPEQIMAPVPRCAESRRAVLRLLADHHDELAGVIIEPLVQGAGGMRFHAPEDLAWLRRVTEDRDLLLICDEIMTGFGRLGTMFACEQAGVVPDIMTLSKALSGGTLPLAATVARAHVFESFWSDAPDDCLMHGPTFMGNALACAAANASLDLFEHDPYAGEDGQRLVRARAMEVQLREGLEVCRGRPGVVDVRAWGALGVVELDRPADREGWVEFAVSRGVWLRPFGRVVYVAPPLVMDEDALDDVISCVVEGVVLG
jgi:adenosylmethionine-8-amino-7-oxononanoate aminotransferase